LSIAACCLRSTPVVFCWTVATYLSSTNRAEHESAACWQLSAYACMGPVGLTSGPWHSCSCSLGRRFCPLLPAQSPHSRGVSCDPLLHELGSCPCYTTFCLLATLPLSTGLLFGAIYLVHPRGRAAVLLPRMQLAVMVGGMKRLQTATVSARVWQMLGVTGGADTLVQG
jgi:hypothetical protein